MPAHTVAQALAYINWTLVLALGLGCFAAAVLFRRTTNPTGGYLSAVCGFAAVFGILAWLADTGLPAPIGLVISAAPAGIDQARQAAILIFAGACLVAAFRVRRGSGLVVTGTIGLGAGLTAFGLGAAGWSSGPTVAVPLLLQFVVLSVASGGCLATLILGHWYLVTPRLSERPLLVASRLLTLIAAMQLLLFLTWAAFGTGSAAGGRPFSELTGPSALFVWLRLVVSILGPLVLGAMAERTARTRSMESATGLLYVDFAAVISGTIVAAALAYGSGLLV